MWPCALILIQTVADLSLRKYQNSLSKYLLCRLSVLLVVCISVAGLRRTFLMIGVSAVLGVCSWHCIACWENTWLWGMLFRTSSIRIGFLSRFWFMNILGFTAVQPWTKLAFSSISIGVKLPTAFLGRRELCGEGNCAEFVPSTSKYTVDNLEYLRLKETSGSLLSSLLSKCAFLKS